MELHEAISVAIECINHSENKVRNFDYHYGNYNPEDNDRIYKHRREQLDRLHQAKQALKNIDCKPEKEIDNKPKTKSGKLIPLVKPELRKQTIKEITND